MYQLHEATIVSLQSTQHVTRGEAANVPRACAPRVKAQRGFKWSVRLPFSRRRGLKNTKSTNSHSRRLDDRTKEACWEHIGSSTGSAHKYTFSPSFYILDEHDPFAPIHAQFRHWKFISTDIATRNWISKRSCWRIFVVRSFQSSFSYHRSIRFFPSRKRGRI